MKYRICLLIFLLICTQQFCSAQEKLKVVLAGLSHDHVNGTLGKHQSGEVEIIGIAEANKELCNKKKADYKLADELFYNDLKSALKGKHPDLVMSYDAPSTHVAIAEVCLSLHIPVMFEKPLAFSNADANNIKALSDKYKTKVYTNYPSVWYSSFNALLAKSNETGAIGKIIMRGGHRGPIEVGCSKEFSAWLTDSVKNGGGAMIDFGCYGATIMTELMNGKTPVSVYAVKTRSKPKTYTKADDGATIIVEYANGVTGITEASWDWPYTIMDVELYGKEGYLHASQFNNPAPTLQWKNAKENKDEDIPATTYKDEVAYLTAVIKQGAAEDVKQLSLERNLVVVRILDAARRSAKEGKKIGIQTHHD